MTKKKEPEDDSAERVFETLSELVPGRLGFASSGIDPMTGEPVTNVDGVGGEQPDAPATRRRDPFRSEAPAAPTASKGIDELREMVARELDPEPQSFLQIELVRQLIDRGRADDLTEASALCRELVNREYVGQTAQRLLRTIRRAQGFSRS